MRLPTIMKIAFGLLFILWVAGLYILMPPQGAWETIGVLAGGGAIFVLGYHFYLFLIRRVIRMFSKRSDRA